MPHVAFVVGEALGHIGRALKAAEALRRLTGWPITFVASKKASSLASLVKGAHPIISLDVGEDVQEPTETNRKRQRWITESRFNEELEACLGDSHFDLVVFDLNPLRWVRCVRLPPDPCAFITNVFLTRAAALETGQLGAFKNLGETINRARVEHGLSALTSPYDLYEQGRVLLADPPPLTALYQPLPPSYRACGACFWSMEGEVPGELLSFERILLVLMGSTGRKGLSAASPSFLERLVETTGCDVIVCAGVDVEIPERLPVPVYRYSALPLGAVLPRTAIVVSHGGAGSTYQALHAGVPVLVAPTHRNHELLGEIVERLGLGLVLGADNDAPDQSRLAKMQDNAQRFAAAAKADGAERIAQELSRMV